jgi:hypothetical protein
MAEQPLIFISYRVEDSAMAAGRISDYLKHLYGKDAIYFDQDNIGAGHKWRDSIDEALSKVSVFLPIIGNKWISPRFKDKDDVLTHEIQTALSRKIRIIPLLVNNANPKILSHPSLPDIIKHLTQHQSKSIRHQSFDDDMKALVDELKEYVPLVRIPPANGNIDVAGDWRGVSYLGQAKAIGTPHIKFTANFRQSEAEVEGTLAMEEHIKGPASGRLYTFYCRGKILNNYFMFEAWPLETRLRSSYSMLKVSLNGKKMEGMNMTQEEESDQKILFGYSIMEKV